MSMASTSSYFVRGEAVKEPKQIQMEDIQGIEFRN